MLNYIHGELWRAFRKTGTAVFFGCMFLLPAIFNGGFAFLNLNLQVRFTLSDCIDGMMVVIPFIGCILLLVIGDLVFGDELVCRTLKNSVSSGMGRGTVYFGKLAAEVLFSLAGLAAAVASLLGTGLVLLPWAAEELPEMLRKLFCLLAGCLPLWVGLLAVLNFLMFVLRNSVAIAGISILAFFSGTFFFAALPVQNPMDFYLPAWLVQVVQYPVTGEVLAWCWGIGLLYTAAFSLLGYLCFFRRELK